MAGNQAKGGWTKRGRHGLRPVRCGSLSSPHHRAQPRAETLRRSLAWEDAGAVVQGDGKMQDVGRDQAAKGEGQARDRAA